MKSKKRLITLMLLTFTLIQAEEKSLMTKIGDSVKNSWHDATQWAETTWNKLVGSSSDTEKKLTDDLTEIAKEVDTLEDDQTVNVNVFEDEV